MKSESGFTLIELLVVVAIIGILAGIALPQFAEYRARAFDSRAQTDLRNVMTAQEAYYCDNEFYAAAPLDLPAIRAMSAGTAFTISAATVTNWAGSSWHPGGSTTYCYDSSTWTEIQEVVGTAQACP